MELGPIQTKWVEALEAHPERQGYGILGRVSEQGKIQACCLGQAMLCLHGDSAIHNRIIKSGNSEYTLSPTDRDILGLYTYSGSIKGPTLISHRNVTYRSLAQANDVGVPWPVIAKFIRENPEAVFKKSV